MDSKQRFLIGGMGAMLPILVLLATFDGSALGADHVTVLNIVGWVLRGLGLFILGGIFGWLNSDEIKAVKVFQIGIAAPALAATMVHGNLQKPDSSGSQQKPEAAGASAQPAAKQGLTMDFSSIFISEAHAQSNTVTTTAPKEEKPSAIQQILDGFTGNYSKSRPVVASLEPKSTQAQAAPVPHPQLPSSAWADAEKGAVPANAVQVGSESVDNKDVALYACRADYFGGQHPGKIRSGLKGCNISFGQEEKQIAKYQVLVSVTGANFKWIKSSGGNIPGDALKSGVDIPPAREDLFLCRAQFENKMGMHPGKLRKEFGGCDVSFQGKAITMSNYEVLVQ